MISHSHKFILITPHKCASVTLSDVFMEFSNVDGIKSERKDCFEYHDEYGKNSKHLKIRRIYNRASRDISDYMKIGSTRNPWDRNLSMYFFRHRNQTHETFNHDHFLEAIKRRDLDPTINFFKHKGKVVVDNIIRFDNLQSDYNRVCAKLNIIPKDLPHRNITTHAPYWEYYTDESREFVAQQAKLDIDYFGYKFGE